MKVLQVTNSLITGGAEKLLLDSIPIYLKKGIQTEILLLNGKEHPFFLALKNQEIKIHSLGKSSVYNPCLIFKIIPYLKKYDIIHVHLFPALYWVAMARLLAFSNKRLIFTEHNTTNRRRNRFWKYLDKLIYKSYISIVAISELVRENTKNHLDLPDEKIPIIKNGIDLNRVMNARSSNIDFFGEKNIQEKLIIQVSRFIYPKDQKTLIKALKLLPAYIKLLLVGDGDQRKDCEDLVVQLGLEKRVAFLGVRLDVPELLKAADVVVLSSDFEGLSLSSIEGMASGRPFLASDVPGLTEIVNGAGILFPRGNFEKLAEEILNLLSDADYYDEISENCMARAKHYNLDNMVDQYIELYKKLINE